MRYLLSVIRMKICLYFNDINIWPSSNLYDWIEIDEFPDACLSLSDLYLSTQAADDDANTTIFLKRLLFELKIVTNYHNYESIIFYTPEHFILTLLV